MDALPIVLALVTLNLLNPGRLLFGRNAEYPSQQQQQTGYGIQTGHLGVDSPGDSTALATPEATDLKLPK